MSLAYDPKSTVLQTASSAPQLISFPSLLTPNVCDGPSLMTSIPSICFWTPSPLASLVNMMSTLLSPESLVVSKLPASAHSATPSLDTSFRSHSIAPFLPNLTTYEFSKDLSLLFSPVLLLGECIHSSLPKNGSPDYLQFCSVSVHLMPLMRSSKGTLSVAWWNHPWSVYLGRRFLSGPRAETLILSSSC